MRQRDLNRAAAFGADGDDGAGNDRRCTVYPNPHCPTCPLENPLGGCDHVILITAKREVKKDVDL